MTPRKYIQVHPEVLRLYAVTDNAWLNGRALSVCVAQALKGGTTFVQLRDKHATTEELVSQAQSLKTLCAMAHAPFVINDDVQAALQSDADGVHVGQSDMGCLHAREILGSDKIIGVSAQTVEQALLAESQGADYLGVGAMFATATKKDADDVSMETLREICAAVHIPVVAIGGVDAHTACQLGGTGIEGIAVVSALFAADDITHAAQDLRKAIDGIV